MKVVTGMSFHPICKRAILVAVLAGATAMADASDRKTIKSVKAMEQTLGVKIMEPGDLDIEVQPAIPGVNTTPTAISPDGTAFAWSDGTITARYLSQGSYRGEKTPLLTVKSLKEGKQQVRVEGLEAVEMGISDEGKVIVATALPLDIVPNMHWQLLAIDRRSGVIVHDLTRFVTQFELGNRVGDISVSGSGTLAALGTDEQIQVLEIPSGRGVFAGPGHYPRLSPDGKRLAFVNKDKLWIHSFADGSTDQLLKGKRVKGLGLWSPDGRFLPAGAWTTVLAFEKRRIIIDTTTGEYAVIGKLGEGDYGLGVGWISVELVEQTRRQ